ncbi:MAG: hypothetical protein ACRDE2_00775 [Chitinophagaceae bacterium]
MSSQQLIYILVGIALVIFVTYTLRDWFLQKRTGEQRTSPGKEDKENNDIALPLRLQAYERLVVFLERIKPESLIARINEPGLQVKDIRMLMVHSIQAEYEHNISQQIYVSTESWEAVCNAKEQLVNLINTIAEKISPDADGRVLDRQLLELSLHEKEFPVRTALNILNDEAKKLMGHHIQV